MNILKRFLKILATASLLAGTLLVAQEGHPLVGSWHGSWATDPKAPNDVTIVMFWDGKTITGMINPGPDVVKLQNASLDASNWGVHFEGELKDKSGAPVRVVVDGKIENLTNVRRVIVGTWTQGSGKGNFKITRDN